MEPVQERESTVTRSSGNGCGVVGFFLGDRVPAPESEEDDGAEAEQEAIGDQVGRDGTVSVAPKEIREQERNEKVRNAEQQVPGAPGAPFSPVGNGGDEKQAGDDREEGCCNQEEWAEGACGIGKAKVVLTREDEAIEQRRYADEGEEDGEDWTKGTHGNPVAKDGSR